MAATQQRHLGSELLVRGRGGRRRVVVTGLGLVSPLGNSPDSLREGLREGRSGIELLTGFPSDALPIRSAGEARHFTGQIEDFGDLEAGVKKAIRKGLKVMCREIQMGVATAQLALQNALLQPGAWDVDRTGIVFGSDYIMTMPEEFTAAVSACQGAGEFQFGQWASRGMSQITPLWLLKYLPNMPACHVAIYNDLRGPNNSITVREASANLALSEAYCTIERGHADMMLAGATGSRVHPIRSIHISLQEELAEENGAPRTLSRPFDAHRTGMVLGEGAATIVLEESGRALQRGARIWGEIVGYGSSAVVRANSVADRKQALANAMRQALGAAHMQPRDVGHIHAHGLGTVRGDQEEAAAILAVFGEETGKIPVVALKSYLGNLGAGGGAVEWIASLLALERGELFATLNYEVPDPDCPLRITRGGESAGESFLSVNVTPQGQAAAVVIRRFQP